MPHRDPERRRAYERERHRKRTADRLARGLCPRCGKIPPAPGRSLCEPCGERDRETRRARYAEARAGGAPYGGRDPESRRRMARERARKRRRERVEAGLCPRCGREPVEDGAVCEPCREARRAEERKLYAARRAKGLCGRCGRPTIAGAAQCGPCAALAEGRAPKKNAASRARYRDRRARGICVDCGAIADAGVRCTPCARRSYHSSGEHKGMPVYPPRYIVVELATGEEHGPWDSWEEVSMCLAFEKLSRDQVEVVVDEPIISTLTAWV